MSDYESVLEMSTADMPVEKLLPKGDYLLRGKNWTVIVAKEEGQSDRLLLFYSPREAMETVDENELRDLGEDYDITENDITKQFFVGKPKDWAKVINHLRVHGIEVPTREDVAAGAPEKSLKEALDEFKGSEVIAYINQRSYTAADGEVRDVNDPTGFTAVE